MTIEEFISILSNYPQDAEIRIYTHCTDNKYKSYFTDPDFDNENITEFHENILYLGG
jgi:hypothetical protein